MSDCNALKGTNTHSFGKEAVSATKISAINVIPLMLTLLSQDKTTKKRMQVITTILGVGFFRE